MEMWYIENLEKLEISEISEKLFRVSDFTLQLKSKSRILKSRKKFFKISGFSEFST